MQEEKSLKKQIIASADAVKRKVKMLQDIKTNNEMVLESVLKPITEPLKQIANKKEMANENFSTPISVSRTKKRIVDKGDNFSSIKRKRLSMNTLKGQSFFDTSDDLYSADDESPNMNRIMTNVREENLNDTILNSTVDENYENSNMEQQQSKLDETADSSTSIKSRPRDWWSLTEEVPENIPFGVRRERGKLMIGSTRMAIDDQEIIVGNNKYENTPGLRELLLKKTPELDLITEEDKKNYKSILLATNAHRRDYDATKPIKANKGLKYTQIIKPLFIKLSRNVATSESDPEKEGYGLPITKKLNKNVDYIYWDDPNELVDRLKLLIASRDAGNTGLDNEIISIIEELKESGII